jgi:hypothetical protein
MTSNDDNADDQPPTAAAGNDETTIVPPPTQAAPPEHAWSREEPETEPLRQSWSQAWSAAAILLMCAAVVAIAITGWALLRKGSHPSQSPGAPASSITQTPMAAAPQSPPSTVAVTPAPPPTVTVEASPPAPRHSDSGAPPAPGGTDVFTMCPDGHEGVVGGHTSCAFAANVRQIFYASGMSNNFTAYSPVTGDGYEMTCVGRYRAYFNDGSTLISTRCYGGDNAEVVVW